MIKRGLSLVFLLGATVGMAQVKLPAIVQDSMVLQRDVPLKFWGWASAGENIKISVNKKRYNVLADAKGDWSVTLQPLKAGGPYTIDIKASNEISIKNVLAGDVWLFSGQSNMVHYLDLHKERYAAEIESANYPEIRNYTIPTATNLIGPASDLPVSQWKYANPKDVKRFSVIAYFFAKKIFDQYHIPIGIINASVGGTPVEAWTSEEGLKTFPDVLKIIEANKDTAYVNQINREAFIKNREWNQRKVVDKGLVEDKKWYELDYHPDDWRTINIPGYWEDQGVKNLDGIVWYRREFMLPASIAGKAAKVAMGRIIDADHLYINGVPVGNTTYQYPQRRYTVPPGVLKEGKNVFVVRVINNSGKGGFVPDKPYTLTIDNDVIDLKGYWQYKVGEVFEKREPVRSINVQNQPTALYNAMLAPITNYAVKGFIWYQGESNAEHPENYHALLSSLISDWRTKWKLGDLPFLYVQLPNFMDVNYLPSQSNWALLREAQLQTLNVNNTAMAVAIDLGEWNDIHPGNKKPIGERLALAARNLAYGEKQVEYSGPQLKSSQVNGNKIILGFSHVGGGLISIDNKPLAQFAIAGSDKKFVWATAEIQGEDVIVWSDRISKPVYVRYAWADNPDGANLYNKEGLPASPFRTDK